MMKNNAQGSLHFSWCVYLILCQDGSLYCGITNHAAARWHAHCMGKGARYTRIRGVQAMRVIAYCLTRTEAAKLECVVKRQSRAQKQQWWQYGQNVQAA